MFCPLVTVLGKCMATRYTAYSEGLWRAAAAVFNSIVNCGLPAVNLAYGTPEQEPPKATWQCLAEVFEWFLLGTHVIALDSVATADLLEGAAEAGVSAPDGVETQAAAAATASTSEAAPASDASLQTSVSDAPTDGQTAGSMPSTAPASVEAQSQAAGPSTRIGSETIPTDPNPLSPPQPTASTSKPTSRNPSRRSSKKASRDPSFHASLGDTEQSSSDAELEASVVDTLTDAVLTACSHAPEDVRRRLIGVLDQAITRPKDRHIPNSAAGIRFSHTCLRKLYVLSSRGVQDQGTEDCLLQVSFCSCIYVSQTYVYSYCCRHAGHCQGWLLHAKLTGE